MYMMNEKTVALRLRRDFRPGFGKLLGADMLKEAERLRIDQPDLPATAVLVHWRGEEPSSLVRVVHHPPEIRAPMALVAGRHSECDLGSIPGASLRHAIFLIWPPSEPQASPYAEAIDLGTQTGISLPDGRLAVRVASSQPLRLGVASADVVILHARPGEPLSAALPKLEDALQRADVTVFSHSSQTRHVDVSGVINLGAVGDGDPGKSCVMIPIGSGTDPGIGSEHVMLTQVLRLSEVHFSTRIQVRAEDLERGVRLGRYQRCRGASGFSRDERVSRVHAFVLDRGGRRWLFDTASTNGTKVVNVDTGQSTGPVRGKRTFALAAGQAPSLAGQVAVLDVGVPDIPS